jgi:hypothetical protein
MVHMERKTLRHALYASLALALPVWTCIAGASCTSTQPAAPPALGEDASGGSSGSVRGSSSGSGSSGGGSGSGGQDATMPPKDATSDVAACGTGQTSCNGICYDTQTDVNHCGSCSVSCSPMGTNAVCIAGVCGCQMDAGFILCGTNCADTLSDPDNCGACGHVCQTNGTGVCMSGFCQPVVIAQTSNSIYDITVDMSRVWWTQPGVSGQTGSGALLRKPFASGTNIDTVFSGLNDPRGIISDAVNVYWVDYYDTTINQVSLQGSGDEIDWPAVNDAGMDLGPAYKNAIKVTVDTSNIYWTSNSTGNVLSVPIGSARSVTPTLIASGQINPYGITVWGANVYWTNQGSSTTNPNGSICSAPTTGGGTVTTLASGELEPWNIVTDGTNLYWTDYADPGYVKQMPLTGGNPVTLASNEGAPYGIAVDSKNVYWTSEDYNTVNAIPIGGGDGGAKRLYAQNQSGPTAMTINAENIFWVNSTAGQILEVTK